MRQKSKHNFNKNIKGNFLLIPLALFPIKWFWSTEFKVNSKWILNEFDVNFQWNEFSLIWSI